MNTDTFMNDDDFYHWNTVLRFQVDEEFQNIQTIHDQISTYTSDDDWINEPIKVNKLEYK